MKMLTVPLIMVMLNMKSIMINTMPIIRAGIIINNEVFEQLLQREEPNIALRPSLQCPHNKPTLLHWH